MSKRTAFLARLIGLFLIAMALPMFVNKASILGAVTTIVHEPSFLFTYGVIALAIGLAMVCGHNVWSGGAASVIVTIFGWIMLLRAWILLFLSTAVIVRLFEFIRFDEFFYGYVVAFLALGVYLTISGFRSVSSAASGPS